MRLSADPVTFRRRLNLWPPLLFAGIVVDAVSADFRAIDVSLRQRWYNRTPSGAHFGGSLFAMTDPFYALMLRQTLGCGYTVWDPRHVRQARRDRREDSLRPRDA